MRSLQAITPEKPTRKKQSKRWLVIGGAGFIGGHLVDHLIDAGESVVVFDNFSTGHHKNPAAKYLKLDVREKTKLSHAVKSTKPDVVVGTWTVRLLQCFQNPYLANSVNCLGTLNVLESMRHTDALFINLSTGSVYGHGSSGLNKEDGPTIPNTTYGVGKLAAESYVRAYAEAYGTKNVILRLHSVFGPRQDYSRYGGVVAIFIKRILTGKPPIIYGDGLQTRPFLFVHDAVRAIMLSSVAKEAQGLAINIAGIKPYSINNLARLALKYAASGSKLKPVHVDLPNRPHVEYFRPSLELAHMILSFKPQIQFHEGLRITVDQMRQTGRHTNWL